MDPKEWQTFDKIFFEHSDTCPSRKFRIRADEGKECDPMKTNVKMAVCSYILDKNKNLLLTKRPDWLKIFPNVWVLPGGVVELKERMDIANFREIEEEIGLTFEYPDEDKPGKKLKWISPLHWDHPEYIDATIEPFYLYESVTRRVFDSEDINELPGYKMDPIEQEQVEARPPPSQHLCLFYKIDIDESFDRIMIEMNKSEVQAAAWASLP